MADIVIRGMEMPKFCCECPLKESMYDVGYICLPRKEPIKVNLYKGRDDACPLVPLPEGHGRVIDADALIADKSGEATLWCGYEYQDHSVVFEEDIKNAPTIVPAEGGYQNEL